LGLEQGIVKNYVGAVFKTLCTKDDECVFKDLGVKEEEQD